MITLTNQLTQAQRQYRAAKANFESLIRSNDLPRKETEIANAIMVTQQAICETIQRCLDCENASPKWDHAEEMAKEWQEKETK